MNRPSWLTTDHDNGWERVKAAFSNDWEQTKHDFGSKTAPDLDQDAGDTIKQATGAEGVTSAKPGNFSNHENAFRFGYAAQQNYKSKYPAWNNDLDTQLRTDYGSDYDRDRDYIRHAYDRKY
jgi:hypothetical protein